jgi:hypothetical protein
MGKEEIQQIKEPVVAITLEQQPVLKNEVRRRGQSLQNGFAGIKFAFLAGGGAMFAEGIDRFQHGNPDAGFLAGGVGAALLSMTFSSRPRYPAILFGVAMAGESLTQFFSGNPQAAFVAGAVAAGCFVTGFGSGR